MSGHPKFTEDCAEQRIFEVCPERKIIGIRFIDAMFQGPAGTGSATI
jgi:hypothetical protein